MATAQLDRKQPFWQKLNLTPGFLAWMGLIAFLLLVGVVSAVYVFWKGLYITNMSDSVPWGLWITIDLSSIALGAGAFTISAIAYIFGIKSFKPIVRLAVFVGFIGYTSALLTLVMDIGRPDRFWHPWVYWNVHSVLWEITWCITIYLTIMVVEFLPVIVELPFFARWPMLRAFAHKIHRLAPVLAVLGLGISLLHQSSLGATYGIVKSRPIWFKPSMPIMFILSAVAAGPAVTMGVSYALESILQKKLVPHDLLRTIARFSGIGLLIYGYMRFWDLAAVTYYGRTPAVSEAFYLLRQHTPYNFGFWVGEIIIGILIPAILFLAPRYNKKPAWQITGALCAAIGIFMGRWNVTVSGLIVPLSYSPGTLYKLPASSYWPALPEWGIFALVGGYALLLLTLGVKFLPLFPKEE